MHRLPRARTPSHPGEILALEFLAPLGITRVNLAERIGVPLDRVNRIVRRERAVTADTALRLARLFGTTAEFWLNLQQAWDLYEALHSPAARRIAAIRPIKDRDHTMKDGTFRRALGAVLRRHGDAFDLLSES